ncbi:hypothetical protein Ddye_020170 [Dipteronia dyeriana]|uniref:Uncharacterized protein n=1 Tax=Dipteronia dyeriana TaxID=168575 RepID=A0AAD9TZ87_9ROSI|nr:hypothetical protein Ddye_020170 [Dipteronia dyeriana]
MEYTEIREAAVKGSVISLRNLLEKDPLILDNILSECDPETLPLHIASMLGHVEFVQEILIQKPEMAEQLDSRKRSALHLATARGNIAIVGKLVTVKPDACFLRDRDGRNPLHVAAIKGQINALKVLVEKKPDAARVLIDQSGDTILHLGLRYDQLEALKLLVETMVIDHELVNSKNNDGKTILDMAVAYQQAETKKILVTSTIIQAVTPDLAALDAKDIYSSAHHELGTTQILSQVKGSKIVKRCNGWKEK